MNLDHLEIFDPDNAETSVYDEFPNNFVYLPDHLTKKIIKYTDDRWKEILKEFPNSFISGSHCLASLDDFAWKPSDVDIFMPYEEFNECRKKYFTEEKVSEDVYGVRKFKYIEINPPDKFGVKVHLIECPTKIHVSKFDFTICILGVCFNTNYWEGFCHPDFVSHYKKRKLVRVNKDSSIISSFFRKRKYKKRNFS